MRANCLAIAIIEKIRHKENTLYMIRKPQNKKITEKIHILWKDIDEREYHFTRDKGINVKIGLMFKGHIEELKPGTIEKLGGQRI